MSLTQFAMVEELAFLVKDNIPCKNLILSMEEVLVDFLQDDTSLGEVLELEPMNPYERLLVHRLADIFGFSHHSVGEGEDRHLILQCCPETSMPAILVTDLLWQSGEVPSPMIFHEPRLKKVIPGQSDNASGESSLNDRETDYLATRNRIFSTDMCRTNLVNQRPRNDPVVARRMIAHALGKTKEMTRACCSSDDNKENGWTEKDRKIQQVDEGAVCSSNEQNSNSVRDSHPRSCAVSEDQCFNESESESPFTSKVAQQTNNLAPSNEGSAAERKENNTHENNLRKEHMGAAKRLFANALRMQQRDINQSECNIIKKTNG